MKKIIFFIIIFSSLVTAQSLIDLKYQTSSIQYQASSIQHQASSVKHPASSIQYPVSSIGYQEERQKKNPGLAILYSLLLPGMGELYANGYDSGMYFTIADGVLWGVLAGYNIYGNWQEDNYRSFAESKAGVILDKKDSEYFANIGLYLSLDEYNKLQELNRKFERVYNTTTHHWNWVNNDQRKEYRNIWSSSEQAFNNVRFVAGALILNRIISVINAVRMVSAYNKNLSHETSWNVSVGVENRPTLPSSITFNFVKSF